MKTSLKWLANYVDIPWKSRDLAEKLTLVGLEVEGIEERGAVPEGVVVGEITSCSDHPNADKLTVCEVDIGTDKTLQVVCGAPNCRPGLKAPLAKVGTVLEEGFKIKKAKLRGVESHGMLCAPDELGISDDHTGLMELPEGAVPGRPLRDYVDCDTVIDWEVTPNRPDWLCHIGIARELAAITDGAEALRLPVVNLHPVADNVQGAAAVKVEAPELCPRYIARVIRNVTIAPSPAWLRSALESVGIRPINNVVDITNFVLMECGQPLHAFDYDKVTDHTIVVRRAKPGEKMTTLDGKDHTLNAENLVIADPGQGIALAGIMGGQNSEISEDTHTVLLESAVFTPANIRATAKQLGVSSESSYRFERGVGVDMAEFASARAAAMICELAGGELLHGSVDVYPKPYKPHTVTCRVSRASSLIGVPLTANDVAGYFERLGLGVVGQTDESVAVSVPSFRLDLEREADLIEEVARLYGLDNLPAETAHARVGGSMRLDAYIDRQDIRDELIGLGLSEAMNYSLLGAADATKGTGVAESQLIQLANPISTENACLRPSLLPGLLQTVAHNVAHHSHDLAMFEIGRVIVNASETSEERYQCGIILTGRRHPERFGTERDQEIDFFDLKGLLEGWFETRRITDVTCVKCSHPAFKQGACAELQASGKSLAVFGEVNDGLTADIRLHHPLFIALVELDTVQDVKTPPRVFQTLPQFPATTRDISLIAPPSVSNADIMHTIRACDCAWLENVQLFDVYEDEQALGKGKRSLAYSLTYRETTKTLTDEQANEAHERIRKHLAKKLPVELR